MRSGTYYLAPPASLLRGHLYASLFGRRALVPESAELSFQISTEVAEEPAELQLWKTPETFDRGRAAFERWLARAG
ncbi:MAG: hypothetical protein Q8S42_19690 [Archangium sp.]|nr:hypothetical protein [Archangium sp.]